MTERLVDFSIIKITESNFPTLAKPQIQEIVTEITSGIPQAERVIALDRVLASIDKSQILPKNVEGVKADPPTVFFSKTPAVVVNLDGDPIWSQVAGTDLKYAINTNWDLFEGARRRHSTCGTVGAGCNRPPSKPAGRRRARCPRVQETARRRELERGPGRAAGPETHGQRDTQGVRQHETVRADPAHR